MPISSMIVRTRIRQTREVVEHIQDIPSVTVSLVENDNIIVVTDTKSQDEDKALWNQVEGIPGVLQCDLIYHNFEDMEGFHDE